MNYKNIIVLSLSIIFFQFFTSLGIDSYTPSKKAVVAGMGVYASFGLMGLGGLVVNAGGIIEQCNHFSLPGAQEQADNKSRYPRYVILAGLGMVAGGAYGIYKSCLYYTSFYSKSI